MCGVQNLIFCQCVFSIGPVFCVDFIGRIKMQVNQRPYYLTTRLRKGDELLTIWSTSDVHGSIGGLARSQLGKKLRANWSAGSPVCWIALHCFLFVLTTPVRCSSAIERLKHWWSVGTPGTFLKCCVIYLIVATYFWHISPSAVVSFLLGWYMPEKCLTSPGIASDRWTFKSWQQLSCIFYFRLLWESKDPLCC